MLLPRARFRNGLRQSGTIPLRHLGALCASAVDFSFLRCSQSGNNNGQIAGVTDNVDGGRTASYTYDARRRLATTTTSGSGGYPQWGLSWTYDDYGNRTAQSVTAGSGPSNTVSVSTSTNRITGMGSYTFYYDSSGNLTQDDLYKYKYDAEARLVEIRLLSDTLVSTYGFDGHSLRVIKTWYSDRTWSIYAGTELIAEYEDASSATYSNPTYPGSAGSDSTATLLYHHDDNLTTRLTTDQQGQVSNEQAHYPYGEQWYAVGAADSSVERKYTSYLKDSEAATGRLNYAVFREHSARVARFLTPDPVQGSSPQRLNRYSYVRNQPITRKDPSGLDDFDVGPCAGGDCAVQDVANWGTPADEVFMTSLPRLPTAPQLMAAFHANPGMTLPGEGSGGGSTQQQRPQVTGNCKSRTGCRFTTARVTKHEVVAGATLTWYENCTPRGATSGSTGVVGDRICQCWWDCSKSSLTVYGTRDEWTDQYDCGSFTCSETRIQEHFQSTWSSGPSIRVMRTIRKSPFGACNCPSTPAGTSSSFP